jgi:hypothetical protein
MEMMAEELVRLTVQAADDRLRSTIAERLRADSEEVDIARA